MSITDKVYVISEWLPIKGCEKELWFKLKDLMRTTQELEPGCISARATKQITHAGSPGKSKYSIVLMQDYVNIEAFDLHCQAEYVIKFIKKYLEKKDTAIVEDGRCRLFSENEDL